MISPETIQDLWDRPNAELREIMAHCASIHVHNDGDDYGPITTAMLNIVRALKEQQFRRAS